MSPYRSDTWPVPVDFEGGGSTTLPRWGRVPADTRKMDLTATLNDTNMTEFFTILSNLSKLRVLGIFVDILNCETLWTRATPVHNGVTHLTFGTDFALPPRKIKNLFQLFPNVKTIDLHFQSDEDDLHVEWPAKPCHHYLGPFPDGASLTFTWHDYDRITIYDGRASAFLDILEIGHLDSQCFNLRSVLHGRQVRLNELTIRSWMSVQLPDMGRLMMRAQLRAMISGSDACPQLLHIDFPFYFACADNDRWIDPIFVGHQGSIKTLVLGRLIVRSQEDEEVHSPEDLARRGAIVCSNLLRVFANAQLFHRMQRVVFDAHLAAIIGFPSEQLLTWLKRYRVGIRWDWL